MTEVKLEFKNTTSVKLLKQFSFNDVEVGCFQTNTAEFFKTIFKTSRDVNLSELSK